jgi:hypothetical protein
LKYFLKDVASEAKELILKATGSEVLMNPVFPRKKGKLVRVLPKGPDGKSDCNEEI